MDDLLTCETMEPQQAAFLAREAATIYAQAVLEQLDLQPLPPEQKLRVCEAVLAHWRKG